MAKEKKFDIEAFKKTLELTELEEKEPKYVVLGEELQACLGLPGLPLGDISECFGDSDVGKSSIMLEACAKCQQQNILPVCVVVEKKYRKDRALAMGFNPDEAIMNFSCKSIEDVFEFCDKIIAAVNKGKITMDVMIFIDSLGSVNSREARKENKDGTTELKNIHQKNAKVITEHLMIMSDKIGDTRYTTAPHYVGMLVLNQIYQAPGLYPGQPARDVPRGGKKLKYVSSLQMQLKKVKELEAVIKGNKVAFGIISKLRIRKNHINSIKNTGEFVIVENKVFANEPGAIEDYKAEHKEKWGEAVISFKEPSGEVWEDGEDE